MNSLTLVLLGLLIAFAAAQSCTKITQVSTEGAACDTTNVCTGELQCDSTSKKCKFPALEGTACSADADCATNFYLNLYCSSNKCTRRYKNQGEACVSQFECASQVCTGGACTGLTAGQNCTSGFCGSPTNALSCSNGMCIATAASGAACGQLDSTKAYITQCIPGLYCVQSGATTSTLTGTCQAATTTEGAACSSAPAGVVWANTWCSSQNGQTCTNNKCTKVNKVGVGSACTAAGTVCDLQTSVCNNGTCIAYGSLQCPASSCGSYGQCNCPDNTKPGTCQLQQGLTQGCADLLTRASDCASSANTQNTLNICGGNYKAVRCCGRSSGAQGPYNSDLTLAYCSSAAKASFALVAFIAMIVMML